MTSCSVCGIVIAGCVQSALSENEETGSRAERCGKCALAEDKKSVDKSSIILKTIKTVEDKSCTSD